MTQPLPPKGVYAIVLRVPLRTSVEVGRLGRREFSAGYYVYTGSALSSLPNRVSRHLRRTKKRHWHIDYLTCNPYIQILGFAWKMTTRALECRVARKIGRAAFKGEIGFGCTDCECDSHLHYFLGFERVCEILSHAGLQYCSSGAPYTPNPVMRKVTAQA